MNRKAYKEIKKLKKEKNALILVHNYQLPEIQEAADLLGDSLDLSRAAKETDKPVIIFCGVRFMAETAKILSPGKKVLLPVPDAGCPMADMVTAADIVQFRAEHPEYAVACYVNTSAEVKAECDICVTSANAVKVLGSYPSDKILFVPDRNLGRFVSSRLLDKEIRLWEGYCHVHLRFSAEEIIKSKEKHPDALLLIHPECEKEITDLADHVLSTNQMVRFVKESDKKEFFIGTEEGIIYRIRKENPGKKIYPAGRSVICPNMKKTRLSDLVNSLRFGQYEIELPGEIMRKAAKSLDEMLKYS